MREFDLINTYRKVLRHQSGSVFAGVHASIDSIISALEKKCPEILNGPKSDRRPDYTVLDALNSIKEYVDRLYEITGEDNARVIYDDIKEEASRLLDEINNEY